MGDARPVLRVGDRVSFDGEEHLVAGLAGTSVRLRADTGAEQVVLAGHLMAAPDFAVLDAAALPAVEPFGLLDALPADVVAAAERWRDHLVEVETGLSPGATPGTRPRAGYDPQTTSLADRQRTKATELGVGFRTIELKRARYAAQGLWGLVDQRAARMFDAAGQADARLVEVLRELIGAETDASTGTRSRLIRRAVKRVEEIHGSGVVPLPGKTAFYALVERLSAGRHTFGSAVTRRQLANRPAGAFTATLAARPGEQVQIDSTPIDVMVLAADGVPVRADLTIAVDVATRTICAAVLRPVGTKAVDTALLLAKMLVPEPMRPGWSAALRMSASRLPFERLLDVDARMREAAARPVIVPDQVVIDHGRVFVSETFTRACERLGISIQPARKGTPTDKGVVEATFDAIKTLFAQHVAGFKGANTTLRGRGVAAEWTLDELQDLLDEWLIVGWQHRPHDALRDPHAPRRMLTPNERYTALVAVAGYLPVTLTGTDYLELLPVKWRAINDYGIRIDYRTYNCAELGSYRREHSGLTGKRGLWEVHYDPYDLSQVFVRTRDGWVTVPWTHRAMVAMPFADFTWRHARRLVAEAGRDVTETEIARALDALLTRAEHGPDKACARVAARTRTAATAHRPALPAPVEVDAHPSQADPADAGTVVPFGVFDADAEAKRWRCDARHPGGPVLHVLGHHHYVCTRHRIWIGPPDQPDHPQPNLGELPEVIAAQHRHLRLLRRLGPAATYDAVLTGFLICAHRWNLTETPTPEDAWLRWTRRAELLIPPGTETDTFSASRLFAAAYPEAVAIAELIGPLHWRRLAAGDPHEQRAFAAEIGRRLGLRDYRPMLIRDPIAHWIEQDCWQPPSLPGNDFRSLRTFGGPTVLKPAKDAKEKRRHAAGWFAQKHRRGGDALLRHRSLNPVLTRDWSHKMDRQPPSVLT